MNKTIFKNTVKTLVDWNLDEYGCLVIKGSARIPDFDGALTYSTPWKNVKDKIVKIILEEGIEEIGLNAFRDCVHLEKVVLPTTMKHIHSYAFRDCSKLSSIETNKEFQYMYDKSEYDSKHTILFGVETFHNTPWIISRYSDFYLKDHELFLTYSHSKDLVVPEGIKVLKSFSLSYLNLNSLILPSTLEEIEEFAFFKTTVKNIVVLPDSVRKLADTSLNASYMIWDSHPLLMELAERTKEVAKDKQLCYPVLFKQYGISRKKLKGAEYIKQIKVIRKRPSLKQCSILVNNKVNVERYMNRKSEDDWIIRMKYNENGIIEDVDSFFFDPYYSEYVGFGMIPYWDEEEGEIGFGYEIDLMCQDFELFEDYGIEDGAALYNNDWLTSDKRYCEDKWFTTIFDLRFSGLDEIRRDLVTEWINLHPGFRIYSEDELYNNA